MYVLNKTKYVGKKFSKLLVKDVFTENKKTYCECECDCGNKVTTRLDSLVGGKTTSCSCYQKKRASETFSKHKMSNSRVYQVWEAMLQRCLNKNCPAYKDYGARGIKVCKKWHEFKNFLKDMKEPSYSKRVCIDRINNDKGYFKSNCRWASRKESNLNRRVTRWITYNGKTLCASEWARELKINVGTLYTRIFRYKWPIEIALIAPINANMKNFKKSLKHQNICSDETLT